MSGDERSTGWWASDPQPMPRPILEVEHVEEDCGGTGDLDDIRAALRGPYMCSLKVNRWARLEWCGRAAVALRRSPGGGYPDTVCARHAHGDLVPLGEIAAALRQFGTSRHET